MTHVLDTDILSLYRSGPPGLLARIRDEVRAGRLGVTVISVEEQLSGWYAVLRKASDPSRLSSAYRRLAETVDLFREFPILGFPESAIDRYRVLLRSNLNIGKMDLRIAAIAMEYGCTVVTRNLRDFGRIPGLAVEDWSA